MELRLNQVPMTKLHLTPQWKQSISILQMSSTDLSQFIDEQIIDNPLLEWTEDSVSEWDDTDEVYPQRLSKEPGLDLVSQMAEEPLPSLIHTLVEQLGWFTLNAREKELCHYLIGNLDDRGYIAEPLELLAEQKRVSIESLEQALGWVQKLEPYGVGARNLKECLIIQLNHFEIDERMRAIAISLVESYLEELALGKKAAVMRCLNITQAELEEALLQIRECESRPGARYDHTRIPYIVADASLMIEGDELKLFFHSQALPQIRWNELYRSSGWKANALWRQKKTEAQWLIRSLEQRKDTLTKVTLALVKAQEEYFLALKPFLKPLTLSDIASRLGLHESTISRTIAGKWLKSHRGLFAFQDLLCTPVLQTNGQTISSDEIKFRMRKHIAAECKEEPFSDQALVQHMYQRDGIEVSRRTIAKYREEMNIPNSVSRKRRIKA